MAHDRLKEKLAEKEQSLAEQEAATVRAPSETIATYIERQKPAIQAALPEMVSVDRFTRIVLTAVRTTPKLLECEPMSLLAAIMQAAQLGLEVGPGLGEAYIIPYASEASFQIGYRGTVKLARNSDVTAIWAEAVYDGDVFQVVMGTDPKITHLPDLHGEGRGTFEKMTACYCVARLTNGETQFSVMSQAEIIAHRDRYVKGLTNRYGKPSDSPWNDPLGAVEMAKKTVVLRAAKMLPLSAEASRAFALDGSVRRELAPDMTLIPSTEDAPIPAVALGADLPEIVVDPDSTEEASTDEAVGEDR